MEIDIESKSEESQKTPDISITPKCLASESASTGNCLTFTASALPNPTQSDPSLPPPSLTRSGRPRREYRLPKHFHDNLPEPPAPAPTTLHSDSDPPAIRH